MRGHASVHGSLLGLLHHRPARRSDEAAQAGEARLSRYWEQAVGSGLEPVGFVVRHPRATARAVADTLRLPVLDARFGNGPDGRLLSQYVAGRTRALLRRGTTGACVLPVPADPAAYSQGSNRQTLRRKVRAARKAGTTWRAVPDPAEQRSLVALLDRALQERQDARYRQEGSDHTWMIGTGLWWVACGADGRPLVLAVTPVDGPWALLLCFIALGESPQHSDARYLLTQAVVEELARRGVRHLVDTRAPFEISNGLRHFQRMLGFRIARVRVRPGARRQPEARPPSTERELQTSS